MPQNVLQSFWIFILQHVFGLWTENNWQTFDLYDIALWWIIWDWVPLIILTELYNIYLWSHEALHPSYFQEVFWLSMKIEKVFIIVCYKVRQVHHSQVWVHFWAFWRWSVNRQIAKKWFEQNAEPLITQF